ncbi:MAG: glycosyltransferase family 4 protein [Acidobacteriota bacterium]|nr:glycosyltransferase family 4 protein [Acidobacteriota bacterium]
MNIALFHATLPEPGRKPGGVEVAVHRLANALASSGEDEVTVYSLTGIPNDARYRHRRLFPNHAWLTRSVAARLFVLPALLNFTRIEGDILHLHGDDWFYFRRARPTLRTFHGSALWEARSAIGWPRKLVYYLVYPLERLSARLCRRALAIGPETQRIYHAKQLVDNGVDMNLFRPGAKTPEPRILFVGTWAGRKRGKFLFDIFTRRVLPSFPRATLCMVSDFCPPHPRVIAEMFPSDEVLARRYRESWLFACPSTYEGFGIPYLEALASGTAIVSTPNEGAAYVLANGKFGVIAPDAEFGARLLELLSSGERREQLARQGRSRAEEFAWEAVASRHKMVYREVLSA